VVLVADGANEGHRRADRVAGDHPQQGRGLGGVQGRRRAPARGRHAVGEPGQEVTDLLVAHQRPSSGQWVTARPEILPRTGHCPAPKRPAAGDVGAAVIVPLATIDCEHTNALQVRPVLLSCRTH